MLWLLYRLQCCRFGLMRLRQDLPSANNLQCSAVPLACQSFWCRFSHFLKSLTALPFLFVTLCFTLRLWIFHSFRRFKLPLLSSALDRAGALEPGRSADMSNAADTDSSPRHQPSAWSQQWHTHTRTLACTEPRHRQADLMVPTIWNSVIQGNIIITIECWSLLRNWKLIQQWWDQSADSKHICDNTHTSDCMHESSYSKCTLSNYSKNTELWLFFFFIITVSVTCLELISLCF